MIRQWVVYVLAALAIGGLALLANAPAPPTRPAAANEHPPPPSFTRDDDPGVIIMPGRADAVSVVEIGAGGVGRRVRP